MTEVHHITQLSLPMARGRQLARIERTPSHPALAYYKAARERLLAEYEDLDEETLADTLEGMTDLNEVVAAIVRGALGDEALAEALKARVKIMKERCDRILARARNRREIAAHLMTEAGLAKVLADDLTLSMRAGSPSLVVTDEDLIPGDYWKAQAPALDKRCLLDRLKAGAQIAGAALSNPSPVLSVRVR
jgi:hypothetical protein